MAKKKETPATGESKSVTQSFVGGLFFTLIMIVVVPVICEIFIQPVVQDIVGDNAFMWFSSSLIVTIIMLVVIVLFSIFLGGSAILKKFGIIGVIALIVAYWLLGDLPGAILPVAVIIIMFVVRKVKD